MSRRWPLRALHALIIVHFLVEMAYTGWLVMVVLRPEGGPAGPLMAAAADIPMDLLVKRRLYAIEHWVATGGLVIYLALTEIAPRLRKAREG